MIINNPMRDTPLTITLYGRSPAIKEKQAIIDNLNDLLATLPFTPIWTETNTNPFELSTKLYKIAASDSNAFITTANIQYMRVRWANRYNAYYWIRKVTRAAAGVITLDIELDVLNTLHNGDDEATSPLTDFTALTAIEREHCPRFYNDQILAASSGTKDLDNLVDRVSEGVEAKTFHIADDDEVINPKPADSLTELIDHTSWYVIYVTIPNYKQPVIYIMPDYRLSGWEIPIYNPATNVTLLDASYLDRSNPNIIKIVRTPYCPVDFSWETSLGTTSLFFERCSVTHPVIDIFDGRVTDLEDIWIVQFNAGYEFNKAFERKLTSAKYTGLGFSNKSVVNTGPLESLLVEDRYITDTKLNSSEFVTDLVVYDSYCVQYKAENYTARTSPDIWLTYAQSAALDSSLIFRLDNYYYQREQNYADMIASVRKNEVPLYTSDFINYMRNGYNYDRTKQVLSTAVNILGSGVALGTSIKTANPIGIVGAGMSLTRSISGAITGEVDVQKNLNQLKNKAMNVSDINDSSLFEFYGESRPKRVTMTMSSVEQARWNDIFHYYGYNRGGILGQPDVNSRTWFNYLKCEVDLRRATSIPSWLYEQVKEAFRNGVTFFHKQVINNIPIWDLNQLKENYETFLLDL